MNQPDPSDMTMLLDWQLLLFLTGLIAAWSLVIIATVRWIMGRILVQYDRYLENQDQVNRKLEKDFMKLKAVLPLEYVRKEDSIRQEVIINAKLDALAEKIDGLKERQYGNKN